MTKRILSMAMMSAAWTLIGCSAADEQAGADDPEVESIEQGVRKGLPGAANGHGDYCHSSNPCLAGEGDCDSPADCATGACGVDNGANYGLPPLVDVCVDGHCANGMLDAAQGETGVDCGGPCGTCLPSLIITEVADYEANSLIKYVELYNASNNAVTLSQYTIRYYVNGSATPLRSQVLPNVVLGRNKAFVIVKNTGVSGYQTTFGIPADLSSNVPNGNGDDVYLIARGSKVVDIYGEVGVDGTGQPWDYTTKIAKRNVGVTNGSPVWLASEWVITAGTAAANPGVRD